MQQGLSKSRGLLTHIAQVRRDRRKEFFFQASGPVDRALRARSEGQYSLDPLRIQQFGKNELRYVQAFQKGDKVTAGDWTSCKHSASRLSCTRNCTGEATVLARLPSEPLPAASMLGGESCCRRAPENQEAGGICFMLGCPTCDHWLHQLYEQRAYIELTRCLTIRPHSFPPC